MSRGNTNLLGLGDNCESKSTFFSAMRVFNSINLVLKRRNALVRRGIDLRDFINIKLIITDKLIIDIQILIINIKSQYQIFK